MKKTVILEHPTRFGVVLPSGDCQFEDYPAGTKVLILHTYIHGYDDIDGDEIFRSLVRIGDKDLIVHGNLLYDRQLSIIELTDREMILAAGKDLRNALEHMDGEYYDGLRQRQGFKLYGILDDESYVGAFQVEKDGSITTCVGYQNKKFTVKDDKRILLRIKAFIEDNNLSVNTEHLRELQLL